MTFGEIKTQTNFVPQTLTQATVKNAIQLPNFIIAGERRSGTTSLAKWIEAHPEIYLHPRVDIGYFVDKILVGQMKWIDGEIDESLWNGEHDQQEYANYFEEGFKGNKIAVGEKSADYLFWTPTHARIKAWMPEVKILLTLRNPIERAWSMYWNEVGKGREELSFEDAIAAENQRITNSAYARDHLSYVARGRYDESLTRLFETFAKSQVHVVILEDAMKDPKEALAGVYKFLGVNPSLGMDKASVKFNNNWTTIPKLFWTKNRFLEKTELLINKVIHKSLRVLVRNNHTKRRWQVRLESPFRKTKKDFEMDAQTRGELEQMYAPHIENLEKILGRSLDIWKANG